MKRMEKIAIGLIMLAIVLFIGALDMEDVDHDIKTAHEHKIETINAARVK